METGPTQTACMLSDQAGTEVLCRGWTRIICPVCGTHPRLICFADGTKYAVACSCRCIAKIVTDQITDRREEEAS